MSKQSASYPKVKNMGKEVENDYTQSQNGVDVGDTPPLPKTYKPYDFNNPEIVELDKLYARDNSGGPDWEPNSANFGDGGFKRGQKIGG